MTKPRTETAAPLVSVRLPGGKRKRVPPETALIEQLCRDKARLDAKLSALADQREALHAELRGLAERQRTPGAQSTTLRGVSRQIVVEFRRSFEATGAGKLKSKLAGMFPRFFRHHPERWSLTKEGRQFYLGDNTLGLRNAPKVRKQMASVLTETEKAPTVRTPTPLAETP